MDTQKEILSEQGLYLKYIIQHENGQPIDPNALYFVLRYDENTEWSRIGRETLWAMCKRIEQITPTLVTELRKKISEIGSWRVFANDYFTFIAMDREDLADVYKEHFGEPMNPAEEDQSNWIEIPPDVELTILVETDDFNEGDFVCPLNADMGTTEDYVKVTAPARDWAKAVGRGFLCSPEY